MKNADAPAVKREEEEDWGAMIEGTTAPILSSFAWRTASMGFPRRMWRQNSSVTLAQRALGGAVTHKLGGAACLVLFRVAVRRRAVEKVYRSVR
jgi:hypothetical protein